MEKLMQVTAATVFFAGLSSGYAQALTFTQVGDTGQTLDSAQVISGGTSSLDSISGTLSGPTAVNLFQIFLAGGQTFSATTINASTLIDLPVDQALGISTGVLPDPQLFLFDSAGRGIYGNDDSFGSVQASLPWTGSPTQSGSYFLAIASSGYNPVSAAGEIFAANVAGLLTATGAGAASPLSGFAGEGISGGSYQIALTGVTTSAGVPEPEQTLGLVVMGVLGVAYRFIKSKK